MTRHYVFDLRCPRCGGQDQIATMLNEPTPLLSCGDCLIDAQEVVELKIVRVFVTKGAKP